MNDLMKKNLRAIQDDLEVQYKKVETNPEDYENPEKLKQQLDEQMNRIQREIDGWWFS